MKKKLHYQISSEELSKHFQRQEKDKNRWLVFWRSARLLKALLPPQCGRKVRIKRVNKLPGNALAITSRPNDKYFLIRILNTEEINAVTALLLLVHEWGHVLDWKNYDLESFEPHNDKWGVYTAQCWRIVSGEIFGGINERHLD
tara:strand:- start:9590 stop:10021 length:432 start_codon:yes stop_codon:yes gene_type:complete